MYDNYGYALSKLNIIHCRIFYHYITFFRNFNIGLDKITLKIRILHHLKLNVM